MSSPQRQDQRSRRRQVLGRADLAPRGAADLPQLECRGRAAGGNAWKDFQWGDISWSNYRSTDDGDGTDTPIVGVPSTRAKFFPVNAGFFQIAYAPAPRFEFVNTLGLPTYSRMVLDDKRDMWADVETVSYPLAVCTMPGALLSGKRTSGD